MTLIKMKLFSNIFQIMPWPIVYKSSFPISSNDADDIEIFYSNINIQFVGIPLLIYIRGHSHSLAWAIASYFLLNIKLIRTV